MSNEVKKEPAKEKIDPVVKNEVEVKKKSKVKSATESFLGEELDSVKDHIVNDMIIPSTKDAMSNMFGGIIDFFNDMIHDFIDTMLFGADSHQQKTKASQTYVSYQGYYTKKNNNSRQKRPVTAKEQHDISELEYQTAEDARTVLYDMQDIINSYKSVSVAELFDLSGITLDWAERKEKEKIGWTDLSGVSVRRRRGKHILTLPRAERLED